MKYIKYCALTLVGLLVTWFLYWTISPFFINRVVNEDLPNSVAEESAEKLTKESEIGNVNKVAEVKDQAVEQKIEVKEEVALVKIKSGNFAGYDKLHDGSGAASLYKKGNIYTLRLESDFVVTNGPDLYVSMGKNGQYSESGLIAKLKGNQGSQNYELPASVNVSEYDSVYIWCKAFSVPFAKAELR